MHPLLRLASCLAITLALSACGSTRGVDGRGAHVDRDHGDANPRVVTPSEPLQCVPYARAESGIEIYGDANQWWAKARGQFPQSERPRVGAVLVLKGYNDPGRGHLAVVRRVVSFREIVVDHANWLNKGEINLDTPVIDVSPNNDWSMVRVWYVPSDSFGARTYQVEGFILPANGVTNAVVASAAGF